MLALQACISDTGPATSLICAILSSLEPKPETVIQIITLIARTPALIGLEVSARPTTTISIDPFPAALRWTHNDNTAGESDGTLCPQLAKLSFYRCTMDRTTLKELTDSRAEQAQQAVSGVGHSGLASKCLARVSVHINGRPFIADSDDL